MKRVLLSCGHVVYVSWLSAREGVEVRHNSGPSVEHVSPIVKVYPTTDTIPNQRPGGAAIPRQSRSFLPAAPPTENRTSVRTFARLDAVEEYSSKGAN